MVKPVEDRTTSPLMELRAMGRAFDDEDSSRTEALDDVSLAIEPGEFVCISGPSGSGKSTLLHILGCLDRPSDGTYRFAGRDVTNLDAEELARLRRDEFSFVFQGFNLLDSASVLQNVELPARYAGIGAQQRRQRAGVLLESLNLGERINHRPAELSGGEQQRVTIARALMNGGRVILADEPTAALDSTQSREVLSLLKQLSTRGHTVVIVSHDAAVAAVADRRVELRDGRLVGDSATSANPRVDIPRRRIESPGGLPAALANVRDALACLRASPLRTTVTVLSVALGIGSVVALLSLAEGIGQKTLDLIDADKMRIHGYGARKADAVRLTPADAEAIQAEVANVREVFLETKGPLHVQRGATEMQTDGRAETRPPTIYGQEWPLAHGAPFTADDSERRQQVVVLGPTVADALFEEGVDPVGKHIQIQGLPFLVKGVLETPPPPTHLDVPNEWIGIIQNRNGHVAYVPFYTGMELLSHPQGYEMIEPDGVSTSVVTFGSLTIEVRVAEAGDIQATAAEIRDLLIRRHGREGFNIEIDMETADTYDALWRLHPGIQATIGTIAIVAAIIGVMATMLVSVGARRREVGIRMAIGARRRDIASQFLIEAVVAAVLGGAVGLLLGHWTAVAAAALATPTGMIKVPVAFAKWFVLVALAGGIATGLVAGIIPARRAASLDPVAALAAE
ncbi:MAG: ATP-binding cassette domain-containing protein [Gammaproteobacteria bacterium]|nr:ATP-binding cassette domain-containing protein [Gammaproteobacteria bacterium]